MSGMGFCRVWRLRYDLELAQGISMSWDHDGPHMLENTCFPEKKQDGEGDTAGDLSGQGDEGKKHFQPTGHLLCSFLLELNSHVCNGG